MVPRAQLVRRLTRRQLAGEAAQPEEAMRAYIVLGAWQVERNRAQVASSRLITDGF
jgi:hypothetical protein